MGSLPGNITTSAEQGEAHQLESAKQQPEPLCERSISAREWREVTRAACTVFDPTFNISSCDRQLSTKTRLNGQTRHLVAFADAHRGERTGPSLRLRRPTRPAGELGIDLPVVEGSAHR